ncbi:MAG TPA: hypothetical protein G4O08_07225 [Anaerolineae bacterium]|nr:hypothetical protein [Anaerolineae bacterium]
MFLLVGLSAIPLTCLLGSASLLFPAVVSRSGDRLRQAPLLSVFVGLLVGLPVAGASLFFLSVEDNFLLLAVGALLIGSLTIITTVGLSGICLFLAGKLAGDKHPVGIPFFVGLCLIAIGLIPMVGWYLFSPLLVLAGIGSGTFAVFGSKQPEADSTVDRDKPGSWLGLRKPAWILLLLSPAIGELLSGSAPPLEFFQPFSFLILVALYGGGALIIRELAFRWQKGWRTILLLGAAYGIIEEGLMVKSFFDPHWPDLGNLGIYGRWQGVNWIWSLELTIYHMLFSIAIPILLVNLLYPKERQRSWVSNTALKVIGALFTLDVLFGFFLLTAYRPPILPYLATLVLVVLLCVLAKAQPPHFRLAGSSKPKHPAWAGLLTFWGTLGMFLISWIPSTTNLPAVFAFLLLALWAGLCLISLGWLLGWEMGSWKHSLALAAGGLGFFILLTPIHELDSSRMDDPRGMIVVGLLFTVLLAYTRLRARMNERDALPI